MAVNITLSDLENLQNQTTAVTTINANNAAIETAFSTSASTSGDQMNGSLDMNSNRLINLPAPISNGEPLRLADLDSITGGVTINTIPAGGTTNQLLAKHSNTSYDTVWTSTLGGVTLDTAAPNTLKINGVQVNAVTGTGSVVLQSSPTLTTPNLDTPSTLVLTNATGTPASLGLANATGTPASITLTNGTGLPISTGVSGLATGIATFLGTPSSANLKAAVTDETGSGALVFATSPALVTPTLGAATATTIAFSPTTGGIIGTNTNDNASSGNVGEYIETSIGTGSAVSLVNATAKDIATITLTAGDWDLSGQVSFITAASTSMTAYILSIGSSANTIDFNPGRFTALSYAAIVPGVNNGAVAAAIGPLRFSLSGSTTLHLVTQASFTASTLSGWGLIRARRIR